jgi:hypothetical protein
VLVLEKTDRGTTAVPVHVLIYGNYSAAENYRNITLRAVMIFYSPIGSTKVGSVAPGSTGQSETPLVNSVESTTA